MVRHFVATVDNLSREQAPASAWPVQPTPQRFLAGEPQGGIQTISPANAARYDGVVALAGSVDPAKAAGVYARLYPLFQQAYEELGYPGKYFNDRLIAVIDHLLPAPEPAGPVQVRLVEVKGDVPSQRPWTRYEYADPQLEAMTSGQKIMVLHGPGQRAQAEDQPARPAPADRHRPTSPRRRRRRPDAQLHSFEPPSTRSVSPVTQRAASEARKPMACAMSSGCATRFIACMPSVNSRPASVFANFDMSVSTTPGATAFTRMPCAPSADAKCFTSVSIEPLVAA